MKILRIFIGLLIVTSLPIAAQQASSLDELLQNVEQGKVQDASDNQKRENEFRQKRGQQEVLLNESTATKVKEEDRLGEQNVVGIIDDVLERAQIGISAEMLGSALEAFAQTIQFLPEILVSY